jgi:predicted ATPase
MSRRRPGSPFADVGFLRGIRLERDRVPSFETYPFSIPAIRALDELALAPKVTCLVGENGSGKSTLLEALAVAAGFNAEGGSKNFRFATRRSESELHQYLRIVRGPRRERDGFFLRAESFFNLSSQVEELGVSGYGERSLHEQSHGESFLSLAQHRFGGNGLYLLDEPEAALSPTRQLSFLAIIHDLVEHQHAQFVIATHSPILLGYPGALIYSLDGDGVRPIAYEETEHYLVTRDFLASPERFFKNLFSADGADGPAD